MFATDQAELDCVYMDQLSEFPESDNSSAQDASRLQSLLKDLFVAEYIPCLSSEDLRTLYDSDVIPLSETDAKPFDDPENPDLVSDSYGHSHFRIELN